jgi:hypothetical protein
MILRWAWVAGEERPRGAERVGRRRVAIESTRRESRVVVPFHAGAVLHPKIMKQVLDAIEEARTE